MDYGRLIGEGKVAEVFEYGEGVLKLYRQGQPKSDAVQEAAALAVVSAAGVAAPRAHGVEAHDGRWGVVMDRIEGRPFAGPMLENVAGAAPYFAAMARLQAGLHAASGVGLTPLKARLGAKIARAPGLAEPVRRRLLGRLDELPDGDRLLHGDFHPFNILGTPGRAWIVDWVDATSGPPEADVCRSWLLMQTVSREVAEAYLEAYLAAGAVARDRVFDWLPVSAAARLAENVPEEAEALMAMAETG